MPRQQLHSFVIYDRPDDYPDKVVVRRHRIAPGTVIADKEPHAVVDDIDAARASIPHGLICFMRDESDDLSIVESWM